MYLMGGLFLLMTYLFQCTKTFVKNALLNSSLWGVSFLITVATVSYFSKAFQKYSAVHHHTADWGNEPKVSKNNRDPIEEKVVKAIHTVSFESNLKLSSHSLTQQLCKSLFKAPNYIQPEQHIVGYRRVWNSAQGFTCKVLCSDLQWLYS